MADAPAAAPAAAPSAPTTQPAASPAAAPAAKPVSTPSGGDRFSDLDSRVAQRREKPAAPAKPSEPDKPAAPDKPAEPDKTAAAAPAKETIKDPKQLRERLAQVEKERDSSSNEISTLKNKIQEYERKGYDTTALSEQLAREQKEKTELMAQVRALKREASPEFKDKWDKPFDQAAAYAKRFVEQLSVNNEDGEPARQATWDDFVALYRLPYNKAIAAAKTYFGDAAPGVIQHLTDLQKMDFQRGEALKQEQAQWEATEKAETARAVQQREFIEKTWSTVNKDISERHPDWYLEDPKDDEGNKLLKQGYELVDSKPASLQEKIVQDAHIRLKAAAFPRLVYKLNRLQEKLEDAEATIAEMKGSKPGSVQKPSSGDSANKPKERTGMSGLRSDLADALNA